MAVERILALTDLSRAARAGLEMADRLAARIGARVEVGYVAQPVPGPRPPGEEELVKKVESLIRAEEDRALAKATEGFTDASRLGAVHRVDTECVRCGVRDMIAAHHPDLVCLSVRGHATAPDVPLGSIAEHVARTAELPVLLARGPELPPPGTPLRLLLGVDLIEPPDASVGRIMPLLGSGDELVLAHVIEADQFFPPALGAQPALTSAQLETMTGNARALLSDVRIDNDGPRISVKVERGETSATLVHLAKSLDCHVIALRAHATRLHDPTHLGSHADRVARTAPMSVLIL
jgi:nucleotide-binding universal stress UspA family protein